jgi:hypothetical protein
LVNGLTIWVGPPTHELGVLAATQGRYDEADGYFSDAVERQDRMAARGTVIHTRIAWADMLNRRGGAADVPRARALLHEAKAGACELGLLHLEARVDTILASVG